MDDVLHIKTPFWSAGHKYGWEGSSAGLGINVNILGDDGVLLVRVGEKDQVYGIEKTKARELMNRYKAWHNIRNTVLGVIPWSAFYKVGGEVEVNVELPVQTEKQQKLF